MTQLGITGHIYPEYLSKYINRKWWGDIIEIDCYFVEKLTVLK